MRILKYGMMKSALLLVGLILLSPALQVDPQVLAQDPIRAKKRMRVKRPVGQLRSNPIQAPSTEEALEGTVPILFSSPYIEQGATTRTYGEIVKDHMWVVPGSASQYKSRRFKMGFKGTITRMTVDSLTGTRGMRTTYMLYKNGVRTQLACTATGSAPCDGNWYVPIDINDVINIAVHLPKTPKCAQTGTSGCAGATPVITLMVRMGG
ncbi:MAG: hypothetical protein ACYSR0_07195 [Planctomycetota bacterium]|jgi:hypothetical protein